MKPKNVRVTPFCPSSVALCGAAFGAFVAPEDVAAYEGCDEADPGPGYDCFGGPNAMGARSRNLPPRIGAWVPGSLGSDFPESTGIRIASGSKIVVQMRYNTTSSAPAPDQSRISVKLDATVPNPAFILPFTNPQWIRNQTMNIAAGDPDATHSFTLSAGLLGALRSGSALDTPQPLTVYSASLHMHLPGRARDAVARSRFRVPVRDGVRMNEERRL